ncbi:phage tail tape measure protein [Arthrobacter liuii]|uniref:Phage tail tape measure protein domain-containing protein n=1 Tax=Arthrobacter liuii TaxID=1476996 RepID=A0ABQ2AM07_9MICC|nr:phage tail tape measure protein [Arthrobacter liuii]GGH93733.1 hypothetical protein GCM10007170_15290 [Arthrobacter liuii]
MSGFLPPVVMKVIADGSQFITEQGKISAAMDAAAANAVLTAEKEAQSARAAASAAKIAADQQVLAAETAAKAVEVAAARTAAAQAKAATATGDAQIRATAAAELAAAKESEAANKAAVAVQLAADKQVAAQEAIRIADEKTAAASEATAARGAGKGGKVGAGAALAGGILAAGLGAAATYAVDQAAKYEKATTLLQTAGGELASNMGTVRDGILAVAKATGTSTEQLSEGMYLVEKAGYRGADGLNVLKMAAEGAKAENVDMGTMTQALTSIMTSYNLKSEDATRTTNMLVAGAGAAKETMQNYASALSTVLPVASAAGIQFDQVGGAIATLTQHGTSAAESTQELSNTIRNLQAPNNVAVNAMQQLGINVQDVTTHLGQRGLTGTIELITNAIQSKLGPAGTVVVDAMKKSATGTADLQAMLGKMPESLQGAAKGFLDGSVSQKELQKTFKDSGAEGSAMGKQFMTLAQQVSGFNDKIKAGGPAAETATAALKAIMGGATGMNTALMLGDANMAGFKSRVEEIGAAGNQSGSDLTTWAQTQATLSVQIDKTKQAFENMAITIGTTLAPAAKVVMDVMQNVFQFFAENQAAVVALSIALGVLTVGLLGAAAAAWILSLTPVAITIGLVVAAVALLISGIVLLVANWDQVVKWLTEIWGGFINWCTEITGGFMNWWNQVWGGFGNWIKEVWDGFINWIMDVWTGFTGWLKGMVTGIVGWWNSIWSTIGAAVAAGFNAVMSVISAALGFIRTIWEGFWNGPFGKLIQAAWKLVITATEFALAWIAKGIEVGVNFIRDVWTAGWNAVSSFFAEVWSGIVGFLSPIIQSLRDIISSTVDGISSTWNAAWSAISGFFTDVWNGIVAFVTGAVSNVSDSISGPLESTSGTVGDILGTIGGLFRDTWNNVVNGVTEAFDTVVNTVSSKVGEVVGFVGGIRDQVVGALGDAGSWLVSAGRNVIDGFVNGINGAIGAVTDAIGNVTQVIADHMPHSPAKRGALSGKGYTLYSGEALTRDFAKGITNNAHLVEFASAQLSSTVKLRGASDYGLGPSASSVSPVSQSRAADTPQIAAPQITVNAQTSASAQHIANEIGWALRTA